jgi:hypothetical protein
MAHTAHDIDVEVEDAEALIADFEKAVEEGRKLLWVTEEDGHRHGLVVERIVYLDVEAEKSRTVGFGS